MSGGRRGTEQVFTLTPGPAGATPATQTPAGAQNVTTTVGAGQ